MQRIRFSTFINAPREKVWHTALDDATYRDWTAMFNERGSWYEGDWNEGSKILFLGPGKDGKVGGMVSRIKASRRPEFVSIEHLGRVQDGVEDLTSDAVKQWAPAFENYTFTARDGGTEMIVEMDVDEAHREMFEGMWPRALAKLKTLAEGRAMTADEPDPDIELVTVFRTGEPDLIAFAKSILEGEGIEHFVRGEGSQQLLGLGTMGGTHNIITGPAEFVVRAEDAERARDSLADLLTSVRSGDEGE